MVNRPENKQVTTNTTYTYYPPTEGDLLEEFEKQHRSYQLFKQKGLDKLQLQDGTVINKILDEGVFRRVRRFLNNVDIAKGPIERKVRRLERRRNMDPNTHKMQEYLVVHVEWIAKDFLGNMLSWHDFREGLYNDPQTRTEIVNGRQVRRYVNWNAMYDIPFSKEAVDEALDNQINSPELIDYFVRVSSTTRDNTFSLEQFRDTTFEECQEISKQGKGLKR